jgi:hypothetical protein
MKFGGTWATETSTTIHVIRYGREKKGKKTLTSMLNVKQTFVLH